MSPVQTRRALASGATFALLALAACGERDQSAIVRDTTGGPETGMTADTAMTDTGAGGAALTDANIVALLDEANMADSSAGALASKKATARSVKDFARLMMSEHHALRQQGQQLAQKLGVTPEMPASDPLAPLAKAEMSTLESTPKGAEFDRTYIEQEIAAHKAVLDLVDNAGDQAQNEQLKALIEKARPVIQKHLDQAEKIREELGSTAG